MTRQYQVDTVRDTADLEQIVALQQDNHLTGISADEARAQGFVTVRHDVELLRQMHDVAPSIIIREGARVVAYALTMPLECRQLCPVLEPMFQLFETLEYQGRPLTDYRFYVMGQICVGKEHRGLGLFDQLYAKHRALYAPRFELLLTEVATRNTRSMRAHERVGFETLKVHQDASDEWALVIWDWRRP